MLEASSCKYLGIILGSDLNWVERSKLHSAKSLEGSHFVMRVLKKGNRSTKSLSYTSLVLPVLEYGIHAEKDR